MHAITGAPVGTWTTHAERELGKLNAELSYASTEEIVMRGVHETIDTLQMRLHAVTNAVFETFFAMRPEGEEPDSEKPPLAPHSRPPFSFGR